VEEWSVREGLSAVLSIKIKAVLKRAHAAFWKLPDAPNADTVAMQLAFDGVATVFFDAGILSQQLLEKEIPSLVWDSAIAGGWWRLASDIRSNIFPEELGHYWVYRENTRDWNMLFTVESSELEARLLDTSATVPGPAESPTAQTRKKRVKSDVGPAAASAPVRAQNWDEVEISFLSDERVQIWIAGKTETLNYAEMGFADQRNGKPSSSWAILRVLAQNEGLIPAIRGSREWAATEKQIERARKLLQTYFGIREDPLPFEKGVGYQLRCKIGCAPSFAK
jgi:hypothetical protein